MILNETIINGSSMHQRGQVRVSINAPMVIVLPVISFFRRFRCYCRSLNCPSVARSLSANANVRISSLSREEKEVGSSVST